MRKLASIQRVWKIEPIEGADRIELPEWSWQRHLSFSVFIIGNHVMDEQFNV